LLASRDFEQDFDDTPIDPVAVQNGTAGWFPSRYGAGDQLGALNEITPRKTLEALELIKPHKNRRLKTYNLGEVMEPGINAFGNRVYQQTLNVPATTGAGDNQLVGSEERITTTYHIATQVDGLPHIGVGNRFYNGFTRDQLLGGNAMPSGVAVLGQEHIDPFITRGILLDVLTLKIRQGHTAALGTPVDGKPILADSYRITVEDLMDAMKLGGIRRITPGDVVIIRTGWSHLYGTDPALRNRYIGAEAGIYLREARWLAQFRPAIVASDGPALEVLPSPTPGQLFPVHQELLTHHGIRIGEAFNSEELAADRLYEFVFFYTPQRGKGATASNTAPAALGQPDRGRRDWWDWD
jgi:kynurenine formamidase